MAWAQELGWFCNLYLELMSVASVSASAPPSVFEALQSLTGSQCDSGLVGQFSLSTSHIQCYLRYSFLLLTRWPDSVHLQASDRQGYHLEHNPGYNASALATGTSNVSLCLSLGADGLHQRVGFIKQIRGKVGAVDYGVRKR